MLFTPIQTNRLTFRRLAPEDAQAVHSYRSNPNVSKYQMWQPRTLEEVRKFLVKLAAVHLDTPGTWFQLAIVCRDNNAVIGDCGIRFPNEGSHQTELGLSLTPSYQGQGFGAEAFMAILGYVFDSLHKHRVFTSIDSRNFAAIALMNRVGMRREAHFRESILLDGEWVDDLIFALLEHEWCNRKT